MQVMRQEATLQVQRVLVSTSCRSLVHLDAHVISHTPTETAPSTPALGGWGVEVTASERKEVKLRLGSARAENLMNATIEEEKKGEKQHKYKKRYIKIKKEKQHKYKERYSSVRDSTVQHF